MIEPDSNQPNVSVVIPAYRAAGFIEDALESVLAQTYRDFEIIVVNDGSPDTSDLERVLHPYADRVVYLRQDNQGPASARNTAIRAARGAFVAFLDADDRWLPDFLESQLAFIDSDNRFDLVYADWRLFGYTRFAGKSGMELLPQNEAVTFETLVTKKCWVPTSTVLVRRQALVDVGLFDETYRCSEDFDLWLRLLYRGARFGYQTRVLACHREHPESTTEDWSLFRRSQVQVLENLKRTLDLSEAEHTAVDRRVARAKALHALRRSKQSLIERKYREAREDLATANRDLQSTKLTLVGYVLRFAPGILRLTFEVRTRMQAAKGFRS